MTTPDILAMGYPNNQNGQLHVTNFIYHPVNSHADAPKVIFSSQLDASWRPRISTQVFQGCHNAPAIACGKPVKLLFRRRLDDNLKQAVHRPCFFLYSFRVMPPFSFNALRAALISAWFSSSSKRARSSTETRAATPLPRRSRTMRSPA